MTLLFALLGAGAVMALAGTLGLAGLQRWGLVFMVPMFAGFIAVPLGGTGIAMMMLAEALGGTEIRALYSVAEFWSAVLILAYVAGGGITAIGFRGEWAKKKPAGNGAGSTE